MVEIHGPITATFKVKSVNDLQRLITFCQEFEEVPVIMMQQPTRRASNSVRGRSKTESRDAIIKLLKETFPESFTMDDATSKVLEKLDLRETTTKHAITWAKNEGIILREGRSYVWTEFIQHRVASRMQQEHQPQTHEPVTEQPIAQAPQVV